MPAERIAIGDTATLRELDPRTVADVEVAVRDYFADIPALANVARCESQYRHTLKDGSVLRGVVDPRDTGVMQINTYYHGDTAKKLGLDLTNFVDNMAYARYLYETQGLQPWSASKSCWGQVVAMR
ncbi:hypothetical protein A3C89_03875 [Candidatus Kaiserbacteria bacterium RIFCSPHIGHO2_02_FULL_50_50]|uniref:Transglycosylase SLT domain-containing protein n=1 Tax=Candidatus Kaiserbacteria bacterium RIFCSPHIGHO2_02_FULL_50_50 TaxID=1798492 RepID=A0A1F6DF18_9BACT|nr:MAG: hypothetical protein A3C89_03875 [Candidatus Kaiserbacteria bacterium RIFCSPHIGHO2_02_FULL_50_50]OGG88245.1 MAG: hypothetical protein A3G62_04080 [Candidatus Kaiserbacteria bacterium RIFCSPLOWO2_12_FULL_50_10]